MDVYFGLFITAFLSATLLPGASEVAVVALANQHYDVFLIWMVATIGNTLGALINYLMARYLLRYQQATWFPFKAKKLNQSQIWFQRYGTWSLLLAWLPIVGDGLTFVAGLMKTNIVLFILLVTIGKSARYAALLGLISLLS